MAKHTTFRIGGPADTVIYPENRQTVSDLIVFCKNQKIPLTVLGKGSNVLVSDEGIRGVVAILDARFGKIHLEDETTVRCEAGASMAAVGAFAEKNGLPFILLSDPELEAIKAYDVWQEKKMYGKVSMGVVRSSYLIDENGFIELALPKVKPDTNSKEILQFIEGK